MGFLDLFRPKWKHSDPNIRLEAIKDLSADDDLPRLVQVARHDRDVRIRRIAIKKIDDPDLLLEVAQAEPDEDLRRDAIEKAAERMLSVALQADGAAEAADAIARIKTGDAARDERTLTEIVCRARLSEARHLAFERLREPRSFAEVVRRGSDSDLRSSAIDKLRDEEQLADLLMANLTKELPKELSLRALDRVKSRDLLAELAQKGRSKALRTLAREKLGLSVVPDEKAAPVRGKAAPAAGDGKAKAKPAAAPGADRREQLCQRLEIAAKSDDPSDYSDSDDVIAAARAEWRGVPGDAPAAMNKRFERAVNRLQQRRDAFVKRPVAKDAPALVPVASPVVVKEPREAAKAPRQPSADDNAPRTRKEEDSPAAASEAAEPAKPAAPPELSEAEKAERAARAALREKREAERKAREAEQAERIQKEAERRAEDDRRRQEEQGRNLARVVAECEKLERLATAENLKVKQAEQVLKAAHEVMVSANPLPRESGPTTRKRYDAARAAVVIRLNDLRDKEEWQRFANIPKLEELCLQMEALWAEVEKRGAELENDVVLDVLKALQTEWKKVGPAPKEKSEALWQRFKDQGDRVYDKLKAGSEAERSANLAKKEALCQRAEALLASLGATPAAPATPAVPASGAPPADDAAAATTEKPARIDWKAVSDGLKALQAEWKAVGLVPSREQGEALWARFKTAADAIHAEQKQHYAELDSERAENAKKKEALCIRAESLRYSTDWKGTGEAIKSLQADWKALGPAPKDQNEALWQRFRAACDAFFERRQAAFAELDQERSGNAKKKDALCQQAEALAGKDDLDQDAAESEIKRLMGEWKRIGPAPKAENEALWKRFRAAADQVFDRGRSYTMPVSEGGEKFSNKLPLAEALAKAQTVAPATADAGNAGSASEVSPTWAEDSASAWADIENELDGTDKKPA